MGQIATVGEFVRGLGLPDFFAGELVQCLQDQHVQELAVHEARMQRCAGRPDNEALPLLDGKDDFGRLEARIPATLFFNLMQRENFGWEGLTSDEGIKDILKDNPQCRVKTVSGKVVSGWTPGRKTVKNYGRI